MLIEGYKDPQDLADKIDNEGLTYFFTDYIGIDNIVDPELKRAVNDLQNAFAKIEMILEKNGVQLQ